MTKKSFNNRTRQLRCALQLEKPIHDTPIGVIHPYWARKPLNIVDIIVRSLSDEADIVFDPFIGSGTMAFSALTAGRKAIASDINPLSIFITRNILDLAILSDQELSIINNFYKGITERFSDWYLTNDNQLIERIRYQMEGEFKNGKFQLIPVEIITKQRSGSKWQGRVSTPVDKLLLVNKGGSYQRKPVNFQKIKLPENSRIAIPKGAVLAHFFDELNIKSINLILSEIYKIENHDKIKDALLFILSSSLPLLRLSDKKATSQWPYWRPKSDLTSRNPYFVLKKRLEAFNDAVAWARNQINRCEQVDIKTIYQDRKNPAFSLVQSPAQKVHKNGIKKDSIDLIITDPPYADHVPYLEYSELWNSLLLNSFGSAIYGEEIVKTDAPSRKEDSSQYIERLTSAFNELCDVLKVGGFLAFFYQDRSLTHWSKIYKTLHHKKMHILDVISLPKQRRSMKTVTSPGRTLDGDLLVVAIKSENAAILPPQNSVYYQKIIKDLKGSFFEKYAEVIRAGFVDGTIAEFSKMHSDIYSLIDKG